MRMPSKHSYAVWRGGSILRNPRVWLGILLAWLCLYHGVIAYSIIDDLQHGQSKPASPLTFGFRMQVISGLTDDAREAGVRFGDVLETVDGRPFRKMRVLYDSVNSRQPGDLLPVTVRSAKGTEFAANIPIPARLTDAPTSLDWLSQIALGIGLPLFCLSLGFWVAFQRPHDRLAWLLLAVMIGLGGLPQGFPIEEWPGHLFMLGWCVAFASILGLWTAWLLLFAILFPAPTQLDVRMPWLKWVCIAPLVLQTAVVMVWELGREIGFEMIEFIRPLMRVWLRFRPDLLLPICVVVLFFLLIGLKSVTSHTVDGRRRLRILLLGSILSLGPVLFECVRAAASASDLLSFAGPLEIFCTLVPLLLFPLTLAYVIVIRRAMDVPSTLRQGIQYALAQRGLTILQIVIAAAIIVAVALFSTDRAMTLAVRIELIAAGFLVIIMLRRGAQWLAQWIDRRFFREAYNNEQILNELALSLRTLMEENTLIKTLTQNISQALRVPRIVFLVNGGANSPPPIPPVTRLIPRLPCTRAAVSCVISR